jgi:multidrug efflux pump subunit AcrA (membrane-fusion protein)
LVLVLVFYSKKRKKTMSAATVGAEVAGDKKKPPGGGIVMEVKRARAKLILLGDSYKALAKRRADTDAAADRTHDAAAEAEARVDALLARRRQTRAEAETLAATVTELEEQIARSHDPAEPGITALESARRSLELEKRAQTARREEVATEIAEARAQRDNFVQEKQQLEVLVSQLETQMNELRETIEEARSSAENARTNAQRRNDARMRTDFDLPGDESELASYSCASLIMPGHLIISSSYLLFQSELGTNRRSIHISQVEKIRAVVSGLSLAGLEITYDGGRKVTYGNLLDRSAAVENIKKIAAYHRRKVVFDT